jgi:metallo-beta-lactamase family protein
MRIRFCGADRTVTGSCHLLEVNGKRLLLDFGMYQGRRDEARRINRLIPDDLQSADAVILSHAHLDHCGRLPILARHDFNGPIYATPATAAVARIVMEDAAEIQLEDARYLNKRARAERDDLVDPLYTPSDARQVLRLFKHVDYGQRFDLGNEVGFTFYDAGHILGSAYVVLDWIEDSRKRSLLFTGDIGRYDTPIVRDPHPLPHPVDLIITESTYGDREHASVDEIEPRLLEAVKHCIAHGSRLLVPSFAVGRTQTMLWYMEKFVQQGLIPRVPVFVDSPMGAEVSRVTKAFPQDYDEETRKMIGGNDLFEIGRVKFAVSSEESRAVNSFGGAAVIIASSPSCEFGRILHHLKRSIERADDIILFNSWTPPHTLGRRLQEGTQRVRIFDRWYELKCQVRTLHGLSAHADRSELLRFLKPTIRRETTAYAVHGDADQAEAFARSLVDAGLRAAIVPAMETSIDV